MSLTLKVPPARSIVFLNGVLGGLQDFLFLLYSKKEGLGGARLVRELLGASLKDCPQPAKTLPGLSSFKEALVLSSYSCSLYLLLYLGETRTFGIKS